MLHSLAVKSLRLAAKAPQSTRVTLAALAIRDDLAALAAFAATSAYVSAPDANADADADAAVADADARRLRCRAVPSPRVAPPPMP
eukprot:2146910-Pleurochrysis_carterae.AAC.1